MKKNFVVLMFGLVFFFGMYHSVLAVPGTGSMTTGGTAGTGSMTTAGTSGTGSMTTAGNSSTTPDTPQKLQDPLGESTTVDKLLLSLFNLVFYIGVPVVAFFLIWSGFMFISAQGSPEKLETAKSRLLWTIIGAILLLGAWTISQAIKGTITNIKKGAISYNIKYPFV